MSEQQRLLAGRYRLVEQIDSGGTAYIYRAVDEKSGETVAVKMLKEELTDNPEFIQRFKKEVQASLKLRHANIIRAYDAGKDGESYYIVMELIEGKTLKQLINMNGALPLKYVVSVTKKLCLALEYAHVKGFVHRDIKPHNVMIGHDGEPYIADFGIAHDMTQNTTISEDEGNVIGSVHYFSPEQAQGERVDKRTDIYSLGIMMFEMLTGRVPFDADTSVAIALRHISEPLPDIGEDVPESVRRIIEKAAQKDKHFRYKSAFNMYEDLQRCLAEPDGEYVKWSESPRSQNHEEEHKKRSRLSIRRLVTVIGISLAVVAALVGIINYIINVNVAKPAEMPYIVGRTEADAVKALEDAGLVVSILREHSAEPEGVVIAQKPEQGTTLVAGSNVDVTVSSGQGDGIMPDVVDISVEKAREQLEEAGILFIEVIDEPEGETPLGFVTEQDPAPGTMVDEGKSVTLWVKVSPDANSAPVPNVAGNNLESAVSALAEAEFSKYFIYIAPEEEREEALPATVIRQSPDADTVQSIDKPVLLYIAPYEYADYHYGGSYAVNIPEDSTSVKIGVRSMVGERVVYYIVYEGVLEQGAQEIPLDITIGMNSEEGEVSEQLVLFTNDTMATYEDVTFTRVG